LVAYALLVYLVAPFGIVTVAKCVAVFYMVQLFAIHPTLLTPVAGVRIRDTAAELGAPIAASLALLGVAWSCLAVIGSVPAVGAATVLAALAGIGGYVIVVRLAFPRVWADCRLLVSRVVPRRALRGRAGQETGKTRRA